MIKTDEEIIILYKNGDRNIFRELIDKYSSSIFSFVAHLVGKENATDITQDVFIKVWKNIKKFDEKKSSFKTWVFVIARNTAFDFLRKKKDVLFSSLDIRQEGDFAEKIEDDELLPDAFLEKIEDIDFLNNLLGQLSLLDRTILLLHYREEMTFLEIGEILKKPLNTVKSYHRRAILLLRKKIK